MDAARSHGGLAVIPSLGTGRCRWSRRRVAVRSDSCTTRSATRCGIESRWLWSCGCRGVPRPPRPVRSSARLRSGVVAQLAEHPFRFASTLRHPRRDRHRWSGPSDRARRPCPAWGWARPPRWRGRAHDRVRSQPWLRPPATFSLARAPAPSDLVDGLPHPRPLLFSGWGPKSRALSGRVRRSPSRADAHAHEKNVTVPPPLNRDGRGEPARRLSRKISTLQWPRVANQEATR